MMNEKYFNLFRSASAVIMDVDGVLTDSTLLITNDGDQLRTMNIRDGYAMQLAAKRGLMMAVITGGKSDGVTRRLHGLGIQHVFAGVEDKKLVLTRVAEAFKVDLSTTIYIGDDVPDLEAMKICGIPCCPFDAISEVLTLAKYISPLPGGKGCVRDILEKVLKLQGKWDTLENRTEG